MRPTAIALIVMTLASPALADDKPKPDRPANRLARETSPYLLQHAHNPVDWYPWGPEAFEKAKNEGKPIFLSVGYSSCYWCHVMERESFENEAIAKELNDKFVCIKVDREERPDVDSVYMAALQAFSGGGGWPMSVFLFPDGRPFYAATYLPPQDKGDREGFNSLMARVHEAYRDHKPELSKDADSLTKAVRDSARSAGLTNRVPLSRSMIAAGQDALAEQFDPDFGGFGFDLKNPRKPKFPEPSNLVFLLNRDAANKGKSPLRAANLTSPDPRTMTLATLDRMARGGIRDHLAGGYHRYSTNRSWSVPHFEKMLYDNAQLASVHLAAYEATNDPRWKSEAEATFRFLARTMTAPEGGFYSALDAETDGEEGAYYVWKPEEIETILGKGDDLDLFAKSYGLDRGPNFEGGRVVLRQGTPHDELAKGLNLTPEALESRLAPMREKLLAAREKRPAPRLDDKILTAWNGLAIAAYADGFRVLKDPEYRKAAERAADFLLANHRGMGGRLLRTSRKGPARGEAYLEDYAFLAHGLLRLHAATGDANRLAQARDLTDRMMAGFSDPDGGYFFTAEGHETLLARMKDPFDNALPGANSVAIRNLVELHRLTKDAKYLDAAGKALESLSAAIVKVPAGVPLLLVSLDEYLTAKGVTDTPASPEAAGAGARTQLRATAEIAPETKILPGSEFTVKVRLALDKGWHVTANPSGLEAIRPTTIAVAPGSPVEILGVDYPKGVAMKSPGGAGEEIQVYEDGTEITARVKLSDEALPGTLNLEIRLAYQLCNDRACLAPSTTKLPIKLEVK